MIRRILRLLCLVGGGALLSGSYPEPSRCDRARGNLENGRMYLDWFKSTRGYYPATLEDLCAIIGVASCHVFDPWGHRYHYELRFNGVEFYSYGTDGIPGTPDDLYPGVPYRWSNCLSTPREMEALEKFYESGPGRCTLANMSVTALRSAVYSYKKIFGKYPTLLKDICVDAIYPKDNMGRPVSLIDPYGQPYSYVRDALAFEPDSNWHAGLPQLPKFETSNDLGFERNSNGPDGLPQKPDFSKPTEFGFELYSNGPDGLPQTPDDIKGWYDLTRCTTDTYKHPEMLGKDTVVITGETFDVVLDAAQPESDFDDNDEQSSALAMPRSCGCSFVGV